MDFFARLIDSWLCLCIFPSRPSKQDKIQPLLKSMLRLSIHFECWEDLSSEKTGKSQDRLGKDVCNSLEIRIKLKLAPTSTLRIGTINWNFASHKTPKCTGLYFSEDSRWLEQWLDFVLFLLMWRKIQKKSQEATLEFYERQTFSWLSVTLMY